MPQLTRRPPPYPVRDPAAIDAAIAVLRDGAWTRLEGAPELERDLEAYHGGGTAFYLASGTAALMALCIGHGIGPGDEVITTPYTWGATVSAVLAVGAVPVFADVDPLTGLIDPATVPALITPRTRAILCVHLFGAPCDALALRSIADAHGILLFEDGSQAHGATLDGQRVGRCGHGAAFSCMGLKPLAGTEGGYALFRDAAAAERAMLHGRHPRGLPPERAAELGADGLLDALQLGWRPCAVGAALVRAALPRLDAENAARRRNLERLRAHLGDDAGIRIPPAPPRTAPVWHLLSLVIADPARRAPIAERLAGMGVDTFHYIPVPIHRLRRLNHVGYDGPSVFWHEQLRRAGIDYRATSCPNAEWRCPREITMGWNWTVDDDAAMRELAACLRAAVGVNLTVAAPPPLRPASLRRVHMRWRCRSWR